MSINFQNFQGGSVMGWVNNIKVAYKFLILVVISGIAMTLNGHGGYTAVNESDDDMSIM